MIVKPLLTLLLLCTYTTQNFMGFSCMQIDFDTASYIDLTPLAKSE